MAATPGSGSDGSASKFGSALSLSGGAIFSVAVAAAFAAAAAAFAFSASVGGGMLFSRLTPNSPGGAPVHRGQ